MGNLDKNAEYTLRTYSGYKGEERPQSLVAGEKEWRVDKIISSRRVIDHKSGEHYEEFVCSVGGDVITIKMHSSGDWSLSFPE